MFDEDWTPPPGGIVRECCLCGKGEEVVVEMQQMYSVESLSRREKGGGEDKDEWYLEPWLRDVPLLVCLLALRSSRPLSSPASWVFCFDPPQTQLNLF